MNDTRHSSAWKSILQGTILTVLLCLGTSSSPAQEPKPFFKAGSVEFTGTLRLRYENWDWFEVPGKDSEHDFGAAQFRFGLKAKHKLNEHHAIDWQAEASFVGLMGLPRNAVAPAPQGALGLGGTYVAASGTERAAVFLKQAFLRWTITGEKRAGSIRVGRFEFSDGGEIGPTDPTVTWLKRQRIQDRLIGNFGFTHVQRGFDGAHLSVGTPKTNFTVVAARPTEGVFQVDGLRQLNSVSFVYGSFNRALHPVKVNEKVQNQGEVRVFAAYYRDARAILKTDNRPVPLREADRRNSIDIGSVGGHYLRGFKLGDGKADVVLWGVGQFGNWGNQDHRAFAYSVEGGYQPNLKWQPWMRIGYTRGSGDGNPTDDRHGTFFQMLPTPRIYARTPFHNMMNNQDLFAQLVLRPNKKFNIRADGHKLSLSNRRDLWYLGGGAFQKQSFGFVGRPSNGNGKLGGLLDVSVDYQAHPRVGLAFYYGHMFGGRVISAIYPKGQNGHFAYAEATFRF